MSSESTRSYESDSTEQYKIYDDDPYTINRNGDNTVNYIEKTIKTGEKFRQTFSYTNGFVTAVTRWIKQ